MAFFLFAAALTGVGMVCAIPRLPKRRRRYAPPGAHLPAPTAEQPESEVDVTMQSAGVEQTVAERILAIKPDDREQRRSLRRGGEPVPVQITESAEQAEPFAAFVIDRSQKGLCLQLPHSVGAGSIIRVRSTLYEECAPWVLVEVRHCRPRAGQWIAGCQFAETLPWGVLLMFG